MLEQVLAGFHVAARSILQRCLFASEILQRRREWLVGCNAFNTPELRGNSD